MQDVAFSQQDPQQDTSLTSALNSQQSNTDDPTTDPSHASSLQTAAAAARRFVLPTILESSLGSGTGSGGSECSRTVPLSPHGSSGRSELVFDVMELPEIVEASSEDPSQAVVSSQTTDAAGRPVITVVTPEGVRVLKDSAKEVHEEVGGTLKVKAAEEDEPAADPIAQSRETASRMLMVRMLQGHRAGRPCIVPCALQMSVDMLILHDCRVYWAALDHVRPWVAQHSTAAQHSIPLALLHHLSQQHLHAS